jgi:ADP-ribose pyrophosphatase YjhB (NUDIX family)
MVETFFVVTGVIKFKDKYLLLRKSLKDFLFPGKWSFCSGYLKEIESAEAGVLREVKEETGLIGKILSTGNIFSIVHGERKFIVLCFLISVTSDLVKLCEENMEYNWVDLSEIDSFDCVPGVRKDILELGL